MSFPHQSILHASEQETRGSLISTIQGENDRARAVRDPDTCYTWSLHNRSEINQPFQEGEREWLARPRTNKMAEP
jgi:hypothetical protein